MEQEVPSNNGRCDNIDSENMRHQVNTPIFDGDESTEVHLLSPGGASASTVDESVLGTSPSDSERWRMDEEEEEAASGSLNRELSYLRSANGSTEARTLLPGIDLGEQFGMAASSKSNMYRANDDDNDGDASSYTV